LVWLPFCLLACAARRPHAINTRLLLEFQFRSGNVEGAEWLNVAGSPQLLVRTRDGEAKLFSGFRKSDQEVLKRTFTAMGVDLVRGKRNTKGCNWGDFAVHRACCACACARLCGPVLLTSRAVRCSAGRMLSFGSSDGVLVEVPIGNISQARFASLLFFSQTCSLVHGAAAVLQAVAVSKTDIELQFVEQDTVDREVQLRPSLRVYCGSLNPCLRRTNA
jgi:hypothetical protein